jgi:hypothetical protein
MFKILETLVEADLIDFLKIFKSSSIESIDVNLYNGTHTGHTELPNGGHIEHRKVSLTVSAVDYLASALESVDYNQVQKCSVSLRERGYVTLDLISREASAGFSLKELPALLEFCKTKDIRKLTLYK